MSETRYPGTDNLAVPSNCAYNAVLTLLCDKLGHQLLDVRRRSLHSLDFKLKTGLLHASQLVALAPFDGHSKYSWLGCTVTNK